MIGYAFVDYVPGVEAQIAATLVALPATDENAGVSQNDAVQLVSGLASIRSAATTPPGVARWAVYNTDGAFMGEQIADMEAVAKLYENKLLPVPIVGNNSFVRTAAGAGLPSDWGRLLALAADQCIKQVKDARQGGTAMGSELVTVGGPLAIGAIAIIVGGLAATVVAGTAVWRYLDPETRTHVASVTAAGEAYTARLGVLKETGQMPAASDVELAAADAVKTLAKERSKQAWYIAGAAVGGGTVGIVGLSALRRALQ